MKRKIRLIVEFETTTDDQELDWLVQGIQPSDLGIGNRADGSPVEETITKIGWEEV